MKKLFWVVLTIVGAVAFYIFNGSIDAPYYNETGFNSTYQEVSKSKNGASILDFTQDELYEGLALSESEQLESLTKKDEWQANVANALLEKYALGS